MKEEDNKDRVKEARKKGEILSQFNEFMERYQSDEVSKIEKEVFERLQGSMISQIFLEHASKQKDPSAYIDDFFESFEEVNRKYFQANYIDLIPDDKKVENVMFATLFPSKEKIENEVESSFYKAKEWYYRHVKRAFELENKKTKK